MHPSNLGFTRIKPYRKANFDYVKDIRGDIVDIFVNVQNDS